MHLSTWVIVLVVAVCLFLIIVPGEFVGLGSTHRFGLPPPYTTWLNYDHGWPWTFLQRQYTPQLLGISNRPGGKPLPTRDVPWPEPISWSFTGAATQQPEKFPRGDWRLWALAADIGVAVIIIVTLAALLEWRRRRRRAWQFNLADLFGAMLVLSCALGWWMWHLRRHEAEQAFVLPLAPETGDVEYRGPAWLRRAAGQDNLSQFSRVVTLRLNEDERDLLPNVIERLPAVEILDVRFAPDVEELTQVGRLRRLKGLIIDGKVTDDGLRQIGRMT